ncbi:MAG: hypothetical protein JSW47_19900 [Phycisphaerales bacterium]|nr:MAG: hypothetical protein JSW47_19900 [Phycisphaerales bacterium]
MKKPTWNALIITIAVSIAFICGCGGKEAPSVRQSRAIAAENIELQKELNRSEAKVEALEERYEKELEKQRKRLEECEQERDEWKAKSKLNVREQAKGLIDPLMAEITRLREENRRLTRQLEELKK